MSHSSSTVFVSEHKIVKEGNSTSCARRLQSISFIWLGSMVAEFMLNQLIYSNYLQRKVPHMRKWWSWKWGVSLSRLSREYSPRKRRVIYGVIVQDYYPKKKNKDIAVVRKLLLRLLDRWNVMSLLIPTSRINGQARGTLEASYYSSLIKENRIFLLPTWPTLFWVIQDILAPTAWKNNVVQIENLRTRYPPFKINDCNQCSDLPEGITIFWPAA